MIRFIRINSHICIDNNMNHNNEEIEIKIKISDPEQLYQKVISLGGKELKEKAGLETDVMYDDGKGFFDAHKVLRIRTTDHGNLLTYKEKNQDSDKDNFMVRTEIQTGFDDSKAMHEIISKLGFVPHVTKQKIIRKVELDNLVVEFHKLPFIGDFIEIEGDKQEVVKLIEKFGLKESDGINKDYTALFFDYCDEHGLSHEIPQSFDEEAKHLQ